MNSLLPAAHAAGVYCLLAGLLLAAPFGAWAKRPYPSYEEAFTARAGRMYSTDVHVWAYTAGFAERFQMPRRWVEAGLEGVLGLAYRIEFDTARKCGFDEAPHCRAQVKCVLDAYFPREAGIPFRNDLRVNHDPLGDDRSTRYLSPQRRADYEKLHQARRSTGLDGRAGYVYDNGGAEQRVRIDSYQYERRVYSLDVVSFNAGCRFGELGEGDIEEATLEIANSQEDGPTISVRIPGSYLERIAAHQVRILAEQGPIHDQWQEAAWHHQRPPWPAKTYEERFGDEAQGTYDEDPHVWAYTREFAERFGMPERWINDELEGAEALAFRVEFDTGEMCGYYGDMDACFPSSRCMLDVFVSKDTPIPWENDLQVNNRGYASDQSISFLAPPREYTELREAGYSADLAAKDWIKIDAPIAHTWRYRQRSKDWLGRKVWGPWVAAGGGSLSTWEYDRRLDGLDMISVHFLCTYAKHTENERRRSGPGELLFTKRPTDNETFLHALGDMRGTQDFDALDAFTAHVVGLPVDYLRRVAAKRNAALEGKSIGE